MKKKTLSHLDSTGSARMVDVGSKPVQKRTASASATIHCHPATIRLLKKAALPKGDVLATARIAGIQAAKQTATLIPLCHTLLIDSVTVEFSVKTASVGILATVSIHGKTGVEMEALTAASVAALTLYDMMKAVDTGMHITDLRVLTKTKI